MVARTLTSGNRVAIPLPRSRALIRVFLTWCSGQALDPLNLGRPEIERYVRWLQEVRRYQPSTVSRRLSVMVGFYRVRVIDQILPH